MVIATSSVRFPFGEDRYGRHADPWDGRLAPHRGTAEMDIVIGNRTERSFLPFAELQPLPPFVANQCHDGVLIFPNV